LFNGVELVTQQLRKFRATFASVAVASSCAKEHFAALDGKAVLAKVISLPVTEWNYKDDSMEKKHIGPMAQDFHAALDGVGDSGTAGGGRYAERLGSEGASNGCWQGSRGTARGTRVSARGKTRQAIYTGTGFPRVFYLAYPLYRDYFPLLALTNYKRAMAAGDAK
jgi:hypothetical protein